MTNDAVDALHSTDASQLRPLLEAQQRAWNASDGEAWSEAFTADADFVNILGQLFQGRAAIAARHQQILNGPFQGSQCSIVVSRLYALAVDAVAIDTVHEVTGFRTLPPGVQATRDGLLQTRMKYLAVRRGGRWQFVAAQNTAIAAVD